MIECHFYPFFEKKMTYSIVSSGIQSMVNDAFLSYFNDAFLSYFKWWCVFIFALFVLSNDDVFNLMMCLI